MCPERQSLSGGQTISSLMTGEHFLYPAAGKRESSPPGAFQFAHFPTFAKEMPPRHLELGLRETAIGGYVAASTNPFKYTIALGFASSLHPISLQGDTLILYILSRYSLPLGLKATNDLMQEYKR